MRITNKIIAAGITAVLFTSCATFNSPEFQKNLGISLADSLASKETALLYYNLKNLQKDSVIFGHQHSTAYGVHWRGDKNRSDVKDVTNSFPGLYGWDFGDLTNIKDTSEINRYKKLTTEAYMRGGVNAYAWHYNNPVTGRSFYDTSSVVKYILPGADFNEKYKQDLKKIADYAISLKGVDDENIPLIFRPYHEFDGNWFWWGKHFCTADEFINLWRFTVSYLRDSLGVRNFIYAYSPDRNFNDAAEYLERYPGDKYVDLLGLDNYWDFTDSGDGLSAVNQKLRIVSKLASDKNKIAALTETGLERIPDSTWWTQKLLKTIIDDSIKISYVMVWRNAHPGHYYVPYKGDKSADDFIRFKEQLNILFEDELPRLYDLR